MAIIPKNIFQISASQTLHPKLRQSTTRLRQMNPGWKYALIDDETALQIVKSKFDDRIFNAYSSVNDNYGVVRADLLRYLLIWEFGGAYFDLKSGMTIPLDSLIRDDDEFILSQRIDAYFHRELRNITTRGEFEQWHVIARPKHPLLKAVISDVLSNIEVYSPIKGVGKKGVLRLSGPISYTKTIAPIVSDYPHRLIISGNEGMCYTVLDHNLTHVWSNPTHYTRQLVPIINHSEDIGHIRKISWKLQDMIMQTITMVRNANYKRLDKRRAKRERALP